MKNLNISTDLKNNDLKKMMAQKLLTSPNAISLFSDSTAVVVELFKYFYKPYCNIITAGHVTPETVIAADHAEINIIESIPQSPFSSNVTAVLKNVKNSFDIIYVSNPNRFTGSNYSLADLREFANNIPQGLLIIDEYYHEYFGISGLPLLELFTNVIIMRSFTASFGINSSDAGYMIADPAFISKFEEFDNLKKISPIIEKTIRAVMLNDDALTMRLKEIHEESLRLCTALNKLGVSSRIMATDSILIRVASPKDVGNFLTSSKISIENLDGYPRLQNYIRYRIESPLSNDRLIKAFEKMPPNYFKMKSKDRYAVTLRRSSEVAETDDSRLTDAMIDKIVSGRKKEKVLTLVED